MNKHKKDSLKNKLSKYLKPRHAMWFEPDEPIINKGDFVDELMKYMNREHKQFNILHVGMEPIIEVEGVKYIALLESPHAVNLPGIFFIFQAMLMQSQFTYGYKFVYLYELDQIKK